MFDAGVLNATTQTIMWVAVFFFASAGASAAYLTVSETWPIEIRAEAIAVFFAIGCIAGALGPAFYGALIGNGSSRTPLFIGYLIGAGIMIIGGLVEVFLTRRSGGISWSPAGCRSAGRCGATRLTSRPRSSETARDHGLSVRGPGPGPRP